MHINLVLPPSSQGGILEKFAVRMKENAPSFDITASISSDPDPHADINHWMIYHIVKGIFLPGSFLITHVDSIYRLQYVKHAMQTTNVGICLSHETRQFLIEKGLPDKKLCYILPATDHTVQSRRIVVGLTTNIYDNHCKREEVLMDAVKKIPMELIRFEIFGEGWQNIIPHLEASGAEVVWQKPTADYGADYQKITQQLPHFDYYLYMGLDEGSMGFLDALAAGIPTIVTPQGFHLDVNNGITHPFFSSDDLARILDKIQEEKRARIASVKSLTWQEYTRQHVMLWKAIHENYSGDYQSILGQPEIISKPLSMPDKRTMLQERFLFYFRPIRNLWLRIKRK